MYKLFPVLILGTLISIASASFPSDFLTVVKNLVSAGLNSHRSTTIAQSEFQPSDAPGMVVSNVNVFNGQPSYQIPLLGLNARGNIGWSLSLSYSGGVQPILNQPNSRSPSGWVGLGWSMSLPYVAVDHRGTVSSTDDFLYCGLGPYGGGQIVQNSEGKYFLSTNPYVHIFPKINNNQFQSWLFVFPDGKKMYLGETENTKRYQRYKGNKIGVHPSSVATSGKFVYRWDISRFTDFNEKNTIAFIFNPLMENIDGDYGYIRESYPQKIYWTDASGKEVDAITFNYGSLLSTEYKGYSANESKDQQRLYETKYLNGISYSIEGKIYRNILLTYTLSSANAVESKRYLTKVTDQIVGGENRIWNLGYDPNYQMLNKVENPIHSVEKFEYKFLNLSLFSDAVSPSTADVIRDSAGSAVIVDAGNEEKWNNGATCTEQFCYNQAKDITDDDNAVLYLQIYENGGNYFKEVNRLQYTHAKKKALYPSSDYFVVANLEGRFLEFREWNGSSFDNKNSEIGDFFADSTLLAGKIESVVAKENFVLIVEKEGDKRRVYPVVKNTVTGKWSVLDKTKAACGFPNTGDYGESVRDMNSKVCLEWDDEISIDATGDLFMVGSKSKDVLNVFRFINGTFQDLSASTDLFPNLGVQYTKNNVLYTVNFQKNLEGIFMNGSVVVLELNKSGTDYTVALFFDGEKFYELGNYNWDDGENGRGTSQFYIEDNYIVEVSKARSKVYLWRKAIVNGKIAFVRNNTEIFKFDGNSDIVYVSTHSDAFYLERRYSTNRQRIKSDGTRYDHLLIEVPSDPDLAVKDWTSTLNGHVFNLHFSSSDPIMLLSTGSNEDGELCGENDLCFEAYYSANRTFLSSSFLANPQYESRFYIGNNALWASNQTVISTPNRIMVRSVIDKTSHNILLKNVQYSGDNYTAPKNYPVVKRYWREAGSGASDELKNQYTEFDFAPSGSIVEFNAHTLMAQFMSPSIYTKDFTSHTIQKNTSYNFVVDRVGDPLVGYQKNLQGTMRVQRQYDATNTLRSLSSNLFSIDSGLGQNWPTGMVQNLLDSTKSIAYDIEGPNGNRIVNGGETLLLDTISGQPRATVQKIGSNYLVSQTILGSQTFLADGQYTVTFRVPLQQVQYYPIDFNPATRIKLSNPSALIFNDSMVSSQKMTYSVNEPNQIEAMYLWQARDYSVSNNALKTGNVGNFRADTGFVLKSRITERNNYGQVKETEVPVIGGLRRNCTIYEGSRSLPVAQFVGAACSDASAATAENGALLSVLSLEQNNNWEMAGTVIDSIQVFDGLYSYKVIDSYGPTRNIVLKEVQKYKYDYVISVWAYATSVKPMLIAEFRRADKSIYKVVGKYEPVETFKTNKWQRWELVLNYDELEESGLFTDSNSVGNFLRVWMGLGEPQGDESRVLYVDNMIAYPSSATFALSSYRKDGQVLSSTNLNNETIRKIYDKNHIQRTGRDPKGRIFQDKANHYLSENQGAAQ